MESITLSSENSVFKSLSNFWYVYNSIIFVLFGTIWGNSDISS